MSDPTTGIRWTVAGALLTLIRTRPLLAGIQVEDGYPGDEREAEAIWLTAIRSTPSDYPGMTGTRVAEDDVFDIVLTVDIAGQESYGACWQRLETILGVIDSAVREDVRLGGIPGLSWVDNLRCDLEHAVMTKEGVLGDGTFTLTAHTRLQ